MDQKEFLSQEKLDTLTNHVGRLFNNLNTNFNSGSTIWTIPVRMALSIEANEESVNSVILEALKSNGYLNNNSANPKYYHIILTRVYILVRYKHHNNDIYQKWVFQKLIADMGVYGTKDNLSKIDSKIEEIIAIDKMISKKHQSIDKAYIPTFAVPKFSKRQLDIFFSLFTQERLFREMQPILKALCDDNNIVPDLALVWYMGRDIVLKLSQVEHPEAYLDRILDNLSHEKGVAASPIVDLYMIAAFSIMRTVTKDYHFQNAIKDIIRTANDLGSKHYLLRDNIVDVAKYVKDLLPITDFDYTTEELPDITGEKNKDTEEPKEKLDALQTQLNDAQVQIAEQNHLLAEKDQEIANLRKSLVQAVEKKDEQLYNDLTLEASVELGIDEQIIFFSSALRLDIKDATKNQTRLAILICHMTGDYEAKKRESIRPRINKIARMLNDQNLSEEVTQAAQNVIKYLTDCCKKNIADSEANLTDIIDGIISDIELVYLNIK